MIVRKRAIVAVVCGIPVAIVAIVLCLLAVLDAGYLNGAVGRLMSLRLGREVRFERLQTHLLSRDATIRISNLVIENPVWLPHRPMAQIGTLDVRFGRYALLMGKLTIAEVRIDRLTLNLVRFGPGKNNWAVSSGHTGPAFAPLRGVQRLSITRGAITFRDFARDLLFRGVFDHRGDVRPAFRLMGAGRLKGGDIRFDAVGGALNGTAVGKPYPFAAHLIDASTTIDVRGTSGDAFDLASYALQVRAAGPNLADVGYIFNLLTPNTPPFTASTRAFSDGAHLRFDDLNMRVGHSVIGGRIWSDHTGSRREIRASFDAPVLAKQDIVAILQPVPPRLEARSRSGAVRSGPPSPWVLTDAPISLKRIRGADFDFTVHVGRLVGYPLSLTNVATRIDLDHGRLNFPFFRAALYSGQLAGSATLDAATDLPRMKILARLRRADLAQFPKRGATGRLDADINLSGQGVSLHDAAHRARGSARIHVSQGMIPRQAGWMLGGDMLRAALAGPHASVPLDCLDAKLMGSGGKLVADTFAMRSPLGSASADGYVDLGSETFDFIVQGRPNKRRLFQVAAPVRIAGRWTNPIVSILPGRNAGILGLHGKLGVILTPLAAILPLGKAPGQVAGSGSGASATCVNIR